jgi:hypothetical protein
MTEHDAVPISASELAELQRDAERLDYLEAEANREPIVLHATPALKGGYRGLGLSNISRSLRQAIDDLQRVRVHKSS